MAVSRGQGKALGQTIARPAAPTSGGIQVVGSTPPSEVEAPGKNPGHVSEGAVTSLLKRIERIEAALREHGIVLT